jgi:ankyrin repeat protein
VPVGAPYEGDPYFGVPAGSRALHVAAWRGRHAVVALLLARGAAANEPDPSGATPLVLAVRACVDSYWSSRRAPDSVAALLAAGADPRTVPLPTGYDAADVLLASAASRR